jgi:hypothetical protein
MSQLQNGVSDLTGVGLTPAAAYAIINTALQKLAQMNITDKDVPFFGLVKDGQQRGSHQCAVETNITAVEIRAEGDAPVTNPLTLQIIVNGVTQSQVFSLAAGSAYALIAASPVIDVSATQVTKVAIVNANQSSDVIVTLKKQLLIL